MNFNRFLSTTVNHFLNENIQLADKIYFNTNKLDSKDKEFILKINKGNNFTKLVSDLYYNLKENDETNLLANKRVY